MKKQKENFHEGITWSEMGKQNVKAEKVYYHRERFRKLMFRALALRPSSSRLFLCNLHSQESPTFVLVAAWEKLEGYVKDVLAEQMGTSLFFAFPTGQKMLSEGRMRRIHTHTFYFLPAFMDVSRHRYLLVILIPLFFLSFSFFLWIQTGFEAKAAFVPNRFVNLPTNLPASTSNFTITLKSYTQMYR